MVRNIIFAGSLAMLAAAQQTPQQKPALPDAPQQQAIPDGPRPQAALPGAANITPGKGTTPESNGTSTTPDDPGQQVAPAASLPKSVPHPDDGAQPDLPGAGQGAQAFTIRGAGVNFVEVPFTVKDSKNQLVPGLTWRDVRIYENNIRQQLSLFTVDPFPLSVALVVDQSMTFDTMSTVNNSLGAVQGAFTPFDEVAIFTYNNGPKQETEFTAAQSARLGAVLERAKSKGREPLQGLDGPLAQTTVINGYNIDPNTSAHRNGLGTVTNVPKEVHTLNDAILAAAVATTKAGKGRRRIVYVISDGKEYGSVAKYKDVVKFLQTNKIAVYGTLVGDSSIPGFGFLDRIHLPFTMRDNILAQYADATGGQLDPEFRQKGIESSFAKITEQVRTQYTVGYNSHESFIDGKYRTIEVKVLRPNLTVIAKKGYFPAAADSRPATLPAQ